MSFSGRAPPCRQGSADNNGLYSGLSWSFQSPRVPNFLPFWKRRLIERPRFIPIMAMLVVVDL